jgi:hypothetical protein
MNAQVCEFEPGLRRALEQLQSVLISGETLEAWAVQRRAFALSHRRTLVAATSGRLICLQRALIGGFELRDLRWQDLEQVRLRVGVFSADLWVHAARAADLALQARSQAAQGGRVLELRGLRTAQAEAVYRICQAQDQAWREKRRIRELEELRARSGGIQLASAGASTPAGGAPSEAMRRLQEAKQLLDNGLISDSEYEAVKARILSAS